MMALTLTAEEPFDSPTIEDERELIERAKSEPAALALLYRLHYPAIALHVGRRVGSVPDVDDLVAETFLAMVRYLPRFRWTSVPLRAWLYRLATNQVNRWAKRRRKWAMQRFNEGMTSRDDAINSPKKDVERLRLAMLTLAPRYQSVLSLHYMERSN